MQLLSAGDVHSSRKGVVGRLRHVDVVVWMDRLLAAQHAAGKFDRAIRDHFVGVHVGLSAAPGLPNAQREVFVKFARDNFITSLDDQLQLVVW